MNSDNYNNLFYNVKQYNYISISHAYLSYLFEIFSGYVNKRPG